MDFETIIGLETHVRLSTRSKIFCRCGNVFDPEPNTHCCPVCLGMPGALPVLNQRVVEMALMIAKACNSQINPHSIFARKQYFYPDLPKGYQITQHKFPLATNGRVPVSIDGNQSAVKIRQIHIEEDAGRSIHDKKADVTLIDFNRCGAPLVEIVTTPCIDSPEKAVMFIKELRRLVQYLGVSDANMEQGAFRCDANLSIKNTDEDRVGVRTELKNLNSFSHILHALKYEQKRHIHLLKQGRKPEKETRLWDEKEKKTFRMRSKEEISDYRYFPEPDLPPLVLDESWIQDVLQNLPETPWEVRNRMIVKYNLDEYSARVLTREKDLATYFEDVAKDADPIEASKWIIGPLLGHLNKESLSIEKSPIHATDLAKLVSMIKEKVISRNLGKEVFDLMFETGKSPMEIAEEKGFLVKLGGDSIEIIIDQVIEQNQKQAMQYREGKVALIDFFIGQVMKLSQGKMDPAVAKEVLERKLNI